MAQPTCRTLGEEYLFQLGRREGFKLYRKHFKRYTWSGTRNSGEYKNGIPEIYNPFHYREFTEGISPLISEAELENEDDPEACVERLFASFGQRNLVERANFDGWKKFYDLGRDEFWVKRAYYRELHDSWEHILIGYYALKAKHLKLKCTLVEKYGLLAIANTTAPREGKGIHRVPLEVYAEELFNEPDPLQERRLLMRLLPTRPCFERAFLKQIGGSIVGNRFNELGRDVHLMPWSHLKLIGHTNPSPPCMTLILEILESFYDGSVHVEAMFRELEISSFAEQAPFFVGIKANLESVLRDSAIQQRDLAARKSLLIKEVKLFTYEELVKKITTYQMLEEKRMKIVLDSLTWDTLKDLYCSVGKNVKQSIPVSAPQTGMELVKQRVSVSAPDIRMIDVMLNTSHLSVLDITTIPAKKKKYKGSNKKKKRRMKREPPAKRIYMGYDIGAADRAYYERDCEMEDESDDQEDFQTDDVSMEGADITTYLERLED